MVTAPAANASMVVWAPVSVVEQMDDGRWPLGPSACRKVMPSMRHPTSSTMTSGHCVFCVLHDTSTGPDSSFPMPGAVNQPQHCRTTAESSTTRTLIISGPGWRSDTAVHGGRTGTSSALMSCRDLSAPMSSRPPGRRTVSRRCTTRRFGLEIEIDHHIAQEHDVKHADARQRAVQVDLHELHTIAQFALDQQGAALVPDSRQ